MTILPTPAVIDQTHAWGDCVKVTAADGFVHCHCALQVAAIRAGEPRTCRHCGTVEGAPAQLENETPAAAPAQLENDADRCATVERDHAAGLLEDAAHDAAVAAAEPVQQYLARVTGPRLPRAMRYGAARRLVMPQ